jgi:hypothetical protein
MGFEKVGTVWTRSSFADYLTTFTPPDWCKAVTLHHTATPSLAQRPKGLLMNHIENLRDYYKLDLGWSSGPHLFIDEDQIYGMCDLRRKGVHAVSLNSSAIGIEVLGYYDQEDPLTGRGLACWNTAAAATRILLDWLALKADGNTVLFHRDDPRTSKTCPGAKVKKEWLLELIKSPALPQTVNTEKPDPGISWAKWEFRGERWCVPVYEFLVAQGIPSATVIAKLKVMGRRYYFGEELLEGAFFADSNSPLNPNGCTWAPAQELMDVI